MLAGALQTLAPRPRIATGSGIFRRRIGCSPPSHLRSSGAFALPASRRSLIGEIQPVSRSIRATGGSDQVADGGSYYSRDSSSANVSSWTRALLNFAVTNFLPIALISGIILGLANPTLGCVAHKYSLSRFSTFGIFVISGLMLRSGEIGAAIEAWPAGMLGLV